MSLNYPQTEREISVNTGSVDVDVEQRLSSILINTYIWFYIPTRVCICLRMYSVFC